MKKYHFLNLKGVTAHNLLINGDFQVNQRGQSSYTCDGTKRVYGVDMWSFSKSNTFMKVTENGIETKLNIGDKVTFVAAPKVFGDGYVLPIVSMTIDEEELLGFDEGYLNLLEWLKNGSK